MRRSRRDAREDLSLAVRCLPHHTRLPMLEGVRANDIIVGAYTDRKGGVCPMLAAHRCGGRTDFLAFAHAWDRFTGAKRPRLATPRAGGALPRGARARGGPAGGGGGAAPPPRRGCVGGGGGPPPLGPGGGLPQ